MAAVQFLLTFDKHIMTVKSLIKTHLSSEGERSQKVMLLQFVQVQRSHDEMFLYD